MRRALSRQRNGDAASWLRETMADDAIERLEFLRWQGERAIVSGDWSGTLATHLGRKSVVVERRDCTDWSRPPTDQAVDLLATFDELDTVNDLPGALVLARRALAPGGMLLAMFTGAGSLPVLRQAMLAADGDRPAARIHPQIDAQAASGLLQRAGFSRQAVDHYALTVRYPALSGLVADLRDQALGSVLADAPPALGKAGWRKAGASFAAQADGDGKVPERIEIVTLTAWRD